jgi:sodium-dependent dicarboxylate transporter 2/3/5
MDSRTTPAPLLSSPATIGLVAGIAAFGATLVVEPPAGLPTAGWRTLGLALMMAIWWSTEPVPIAVTALLPLIALPILGVADMGAAAAPYANPLVYLFLGGFLLAAAAKQWGLHVRMAHVAMRMIGGGPRRLILGVMCAAGFLSMWISNTAAVVLLLPVASSIIATVEEAAGPGEEARRFARALMLGLAYAASIGGVGTLIGTPPNALLAGYLRERHHIDLSFVVWSAIAMPLVVVFLPLAWLILTRLVFPVGRRLATVDRDGDLVGRMPVEPGLTAAQWRLGALFLLAAGLWVGRPFVNRLPGLEGLSDPGIALLCAALLFAIPSGEPSHRRFLLVWREARDIPWQILILFGGGLSLAAAIDSSGLAAWIGRGLTGLDGMPAPLFLFVLTASVVVLTELASNTATVAAFLPIVGAIATAHGMDVVTLSVAVAMAASCAFMLPVATPPNALVFATGHVRIVDMVRAGLAMNVLSIALVSLAAWTAAPLLGFLK